MFEKTFCSSPWFHLRLTYNGDFSSCRWAKNPKSTQNFKDAKLLQFYNSDEMKFLRTQILDGKYLDHCSDCYYEESFGKLNGRIRQLNKSAIDTQDFFLTLRSSPHYENFSFSHENKGLSNLYPVDLQIDLGNKCNSGCIMCIPEASSKLHNDYKKLNKINSNLFAEPKKIDCWGDDNGLLNKFINEITELSNLRYIHFLGGESLYQQSFFQICETLVESNHAKNIIVGTTTNGTIYNERICRLFSHFKEFHLGISIESVTPLNDYIRYPGKIDNIIKNIKKFLDLRKTHKNLYISLRITPNVFSIYELDKLFEFMIENNVIAESCNILQEPKQLRIELIPDDIRNEIKHKLEKLIKFYNLTSHNTKNVRRADIIFDTISDTVVDYYNFINTYQTIDNLEKLRYDLVNFIKSFELLRSNSIIDYTPRYEKFLRSYGY